VIEDIPEDIRVEATQHTIHRDFCPACKKHVEPVVPDAMPKATLGHRAVGLTGWLHYGLGVTIQQVVEVLGHQFRTRLSAGGLVGAWQRLARVLEPWYRQIAEEATHSAVLHADETGWRVNGQAHWLWCFANREACYYMIDRSRGSPALEKFFIDAFDGVLVTDFWAAYDSVWAEGRQLCLVHLLPVHRLPIALALQLRPAGEQLRPRLLDEEGEEGRLLAAHPQKRPCKRIGALLGLRFGVVDVPGNPAGDLWLAGRLAGQGGGNRVGRRLIVVTAEHTGDRHHLRQERAGAFRLILSERQLEQTGLDAGCTAEMPCRRDDRVQQPLYRLFRGRVAPHATDEGGKSLGPARRDGPRIGASVAQA